MLSPTLQRQAQSFLHFALIAGYAYLILSHRKLFVIWGQVAILLKDNLTFDVLFALYEQGHAHFLRTALVFPVLYFADYFSFDQQVTYSLFLLFLFYLMFRMLSNLLTAYGTPRSYHSLVLIGLLALSFMMNGRLVNSFFGNALLLFTLYYREIDRRISAPLFGLLVVVSLWFASVSSGTFFVGVGTILCFYGLRIVLNSSATGRKTFTSLLFVAGICVLIAPFAYIYWKKNLSFYGDSVVAMFTHGPGELILKHIHWALVFLPFIPLAIHFCLRLVRKDPALSVPIAMAITASAIGPFGYSTFNSGIPAFIILACVAVFPRYSVRPSNMLGKKLVLARPNFYQSNPGSFHAEGVGQY